MAFDGKMRIQFILNNQKVNAEVHPDLSLLDFLRDHARLTGTKNGCGEGHCGACTVIVDGRAERACLLKMPKLTGKKVETIEALSDSKGLHPLQQAFIESGAIQCGFCTPGMIMSAKALLGSNPAPSVDQIKMALSGNLCRCGSYLRIIDAIQSASKIISEGGEGPSTGQILNQESLVVGRNVERKEARLKATGQIRYADDLYLDGMLCGEILWSAHPHAEILSIDTAEAKKLPGVHAVLTAEDVPGPNNVGAGQPVLAGEKVRFIGDPVSVVFAETEDLAKMAVEKIKVTYKVLEGVFATDRALEATAPKIHKGGNIDAYIPFHKGDVTKGFAESDVILEETYDTPFVEHGYLETEAGVAVPHEGGLIIWCFSQQPRTNRDIVATCLSLPAEKVRFAEIPCGGSFGGKWTVSLHALLGLGALVTQRPVKIVLSRQESMRMHLKRNAVHLKYRMGAKKDGHITALEVKIISDQGAYSPLGIFCLEQMMIFAAGPYVIPNVKIDGYSIFTNKVPGGAMRGFGDNMVAFPMESHMDLMARKLEMDPFEFRIINALEIGKATGSGQILKASVPIKQCLIEAKEKAASEMPLIKSDKKIGMGVAAAFKNVGGGGSSGAMAELCENGKILIRIECPDVGQGSNTVMAQIAAQTLGVPYENVQVISGDTHEAPPTGFTGAQRVTINAGNAVLKASQSLKKRIFSRISVEYGFNVDQITLKNDTIVDAKTGRPILSLRNLGQRTIAEGEILKSEEYHEMPEVFTLSPNGNTDLAIPQDKYANYPTYSYMVHVVFVEADEKTGKVNVRKVIAVHDVGKAIHPQSCQSQIEGAIMMGLGYALSEEFIIENGWNLTDSLKKCCIPSIRDVPEIDVYLIEDPEPLGPFQAKGMSEAATVAVTPAIINGIYDAIGVRITHLPADGQKILNALKQKSL